MLAPVCLFVYKRPFHTAKTLEALSKNNEAAGTDLWIFSDGWRTDTDRPAVEDVRRVCRQSAGFRSVRLIERGANYGLARNIIEGVSEILQAEPTVIVLEDDHETSPFFLRYMNEGLRLYADQPLVGSIHAYLYPFRRPLRRTFFLKGGDCWGWATWRRAWAHFNPDGPSLLRELRSKDLTSDFDLGGAAAYVRMLEDQIAGRNQSWAVRWHASLFLKGMLTLYPSDSLVQNIGMDSTGEHCGTNPHYRVALAGSPIEVRKQALEEDREAVRQLRIFFRRQNPWWKRYVPQALKDFIRRWRP